MTVRIHRRPDDLPTSAEIEPWRDVPVAIAIDLVPTEQLDHHIRPINPPGQQPKLFGLAVTARCTPPDFGAVLYALLHVGPGDVLVIAADGIDHTAMIGEILSGYLRSLGASGLVCDGAIRDVATLAAWGDFSVFARAVNPRGPTSATEGDVNLPVTIGDHLIRPGDLIIGDDDGLAALSRATVRSRLGDAKAKRALEATWVEGLASRKPINEIFDLEAPNEADDHQL